MLRFDLRRYVLLCVRYMLIILPLDIDPKLLSSKPVTTLAELGIVSSPVALYSLVLGLGDTSVLNGTTNEKRMVSDSPLPTSSP